MIGRVYQRFLNNVVFQLDDQMAEDFGFHKTDEVAASLDPDITGVIVGFDMKINYLKMSKAGMVSGCRINEIMRLFGNQERWQEKCAFESRATT